MNGRGDLLSTRFLDFIVKIVQLVDMLPTTVAGRHIGGQLMDAGTSCGANYEEGCGAESRADFVHKLSVSLKELKETRYWLRLVQKTEMLTSELINPMLQECEQLCAILGKSISTAKRDPTKSRRT